MKKIFISIICFLLYPTFAFGAIAAGWNATSTSPGYIAPTAINGNIPYIQVPFLNATSSTASTLTGGFLSQASSTILGNLNIYSGSLNINATPVAGSFIMASSTVGAAFSASYIGHNSTTCDTYNWTNNGGTTLAFTLRTCPTGASNADLRSIPMSVVYQASAAATGGLNFINSADAPMRWAIGGNSFSSEKMRLTSNGFAYGTTTPLGAFDIDSPFTSTTTLVVQATTSQTAAVVDVRDSTGASLLTVLPSGKVGIGISNPISPFEVSGDGSNPLVSLNGTGGGQRWDIYSYIDGGLYFNNQNIGTAFIIRTDGSLSIKGDLIVPTPHDLEVTGNNSAIDYIHSGINYFGGITNFRNISAGATTIQINGTLGLFGIGSSTPFTPFSMDVASTSGGTPVGTPTGFGIRFLFDGLVHFAFDIYGRVVHRGAVGTLTSCGTSATLDPGSNDEGGIIRVGTGVGLSSCTYTFKYPRSTSVLTICPVTQVNGALGTFEASTTLTGVTITATSIANLVYSYQCSAYGN